MEGRGQRVGSERMGEEREKGVGVLDDVGGKEKSIGKEGEGTVNMGRMTGFLD